MDQGLGRGIMSLVFSTSLMFSTNFYILVSVIALWLAFWAVMLIDCRKRSENEFHTEMVNAKRLWTMLLIVGIPWSSIIYFVTVKRKD